jgi:mannose-6-phosphate isomerase
MVAAKDQFAGRLKEGVRLANAFSSLEGYPCSCKATSMTLELASERAVRKPWGKSDLRPWSSLGGDGAPVGEIWFQRADSAAPEPALLLKLLFTGEALSIQVHPDDAFARTIGLPNGKTEAWYVLSADPGAEVSLGLNHSVTPQQLRAAIVDGTIVGLTHRQVVHAGDAIVVSAGTIHAIGAGLVIAEIQQRSDATFRLFDHGRDRELHPDAAVGAAVAGPALAQAASERISAARLVVATCPFFVLEQIDLAPYSDWEVNADREVWVLLVGGEAEFDLVHVACGKAVFIDGQCVRVRVGASAVRGLLAYVASEPVSVLLQRRTDNSHETRVGRLRKLASDHKPAPIPPTHREIHV